MNNQSCTNFSPPWFTGRWRDWHRGHGCNLDDGKRRSEEAEREILEHDHDVYVRQPLRRGAQ